MPVAILQMGGGVELRSTDPLTLQTLWRLMASAVPADALATVEGPPDIPCVDGTDPS